MIFQGIAPQQEADSESIEKPGTVELTIVMPCLNEARTLGACIARAKTFLDEHDVVGEIIVADNGSTDGSQQIAEDLGARVVPVKQRGYGSALAGGIAAANGEFVIMGDSDCSYDFSALMPFVEELRAGHDLVMGNRFRGGIRPGAMPPMHRYFGNPLLSAIGRLFFKSPCGDFYCGLRGFRRQAVLDLELQSPGMEFALEMLVKATMSGLRITEVPTTLDPDGRDRQPHLRTWRDGWRSLRFYLLFSPRWLFLYPGLALMLIGLLLGAWLLPGSRHIGSITLDVHTLLFAAVAVSIGFQTAAFGVFGKMLALVSGLHPPNPRLERLLGRPLLEKGLIAGFALILTGFVLAGYATFRWMQTDFGDIDPFIGMRRIIPAALCLMLGCQVTISSFFFSLIDLQRQKHRCRGEKTTS